MRRCITTTLVVLALVGNARDGGAQAHVRGDGQQHPVATPAPAAPQNQAPPTGSRFTSTLKYVPPPPDVRPGPFLPGGFVGQRPFIFGRFAFWPWGAWLPVPVYTSPTPYELPLEGAPVGGLQLDIDPRGAQVYVDGTYAGLVQEFSGYFHHLDLPAGATFHVVVAPGATLTQRATLSRAYGR
jgi:hypothetical protein